LGAGSNATLTVGAITTTGDDLQTIAITVSEDGDMVLPSITATAGDIDASTMTINVGVGGTFGNAGVPTVIAADSIETAIITVGAAATLRADFTYAGTTTVTAAAGSTIDIDTIGLTGEEASFTISGRATTNAAVTVVGETTYNFSGMNTAVAQTVTATDASDKIIIGNNVGNTIITGAGDDSITGGAGADDITGGAGADTINVGASDRATDVVRVSAVVGTSSHSATVAGTATTSAAAQDTVSGFDVADDTLVVTLTNVNAYNHGTDLAVGTGAGTVNGTLTTTAGYASASNILLINTNGNAAFNDVGDLAIRFATLTLNEVSQYGTADFLQVSDVAGRIAYNITGTAAADTIVGGALADTITGGAGADTLTGGTGADVFVYHAADDSTALAMDVITDFTTADRVSFDTTGDGGTTNDAAVAGDVANQFLAGMATGTLAAAIAADATFADALTEFLAAASFVNNDVAGFVYDGNTYIVHADADNQAGNIIELTGVVVTAITEVTTTDVFGFTI